MGPGILVFFQSNQKNRILLNGMMKVVGPVETGDSKALPDLSRMLHKNRRVRIPMTPVQAKLLLDSHRLWERLSSWG
jgi:hypothetical protein